MRVLKHGAKLGLAVTTILAGSLAVAGPANAASSPIAACGGGSYHEIDHHDLDGFATVHLLYNGKTNCVVTWKTRDIGIKTDTEAWVGIWGSSNPVINEGMFGYYAGPVKVDAAGKCITWEGSVMDNNFTHAWGPAGPTHCG